jgi:hypothetical protein
MGLDVRVPVGLMFGIMGMLLAGSGVLGDQTIYAKSLGININAIWGGVMIAFAAVLLILSSRHTRPSAREKGR